MIVKNYHIIKYYFNINKLKWNNFTRHFFRQGLNEFMFDKKGKQSIQHQVSNQVGPCVQWQFASDRSIFPVNHCPFLQSPCKFAPFALRIQNQGIFGGRQYRVNRTGKWEVAMAKRLRWLARSTWRSRKLLARV